MQYIIGLIDAPSQSLTTRLGGTEVSITLSTYKGLTYADISSDGEPVVYGRRCVSGMSIVPRWFENEIGGTFAFIDKDGEYPNYQRFNSTDCVLVYTPSSGD